ncbi:GRAS family transcription factor [Striga asiatica]|uniref:GRAS family transcription factor n=1 Tax=Striga asiatica TaxID=4170 RepID=A0A5A7PQH5_STRAF|nr:GRAS family transcription factor [Striga asiatica]
MDQTGQHNGSTSGMKFSNQTLPVFVDPNLISNLRVSDNTFINGTSPNDVTPVSTRSNPYVQIQSSEGSPHEDLDLSDMVLKYINHILMEEDVEEKASMFEESAALQAAEKSFYEVIGKQYPISKHYSSKRVLDLNQTFVVDPSENSSNSTKTLSPDWNYDATNVVPSQSSHSSSSSNGTITDFPIDSPVSTLKIPDIFSDSRSAMQFKKGAEEASRFLPTDSKLVLNPLEKAQNPSSVSRGKRNPPHETPGLQEDERSNKQSAIYTESNVSPAMFDMVLLCSDGKNEQAIREELIEVTKSTPPHNIPPHEPDTGKNTTKKKKRGKRNVVDMRTLLTLCAQAVAADDRRTASEFLKQIRQHSSPTGDGMQRLAHYFAQGLEARLAGSGTQIYKSLFNMPTSAADFLRAYHIYLATCPFRKLSNFFSNRTFMNVASDVSTLHIVDFGILYGFQWPCLIQRLSTRPGGPPRLRITGIDFPCPGFRPAERVEETGRRLARYAETFKVPFEFNAIAQKWETVRLVDLGIKNDETVVVNCLYRFRNLLDETVVLNSPRNVVLSLIRQMNPAVFVMGIVNGAYNAPFFITRFREALFHYSSFFDMLDENIPRETPERVLLEKSILGREAMNVIACEGAERIERPETYKQWQVRNMRVGFEQLPLDEELMRIARGRVKSSYHKDFIVDEDGHWLLQGWKGRIVYALSTWRPAC